MLPHMERNCAILKCNFISGYVESYLMFFVFFFSCPVDEKLISHFDGSWTNNGLFETQVFAFMKTFRFTGSPALYIECDVRMCHGDCPVRFYFLNNFQVKYINLYTFDNFGIILFSNTF